MLAALPFFCYIIAAITFIMGFRMQGWELPLSALLALSAGYISSRPRLSMPAFSISAGITLMLWTLFSILSSFLMDTSYDGTYYHQEIIISLLNGWNPFHEFHYNGSPYISIWEVHYCKAIEMAEAVVAKCLGSIDSARMVNFCIISGPAFILYGVLPRLGITSRLRKVALTLLAAFNPVGLSQALTFYIDFSTYYLLLLAIIFLTMPADRRSFSLWGIAAIIIFAAGIKLTALFYIGICMMIAMVYHLVCKHFKSAISTATVSAGALLAGLLLFGYHPYVTNTLEAGNPFYPLMGNNTVDIMSGNTPALFADGNRFSNFIRSLLSFNPPLYDEREGGFGPLMPLMLILSVAVFIIRFYGFKCNLAFRKELSVSLLISISALGSCFIFEQSWWARYISFLWLTPLSAAFAAFLPSQREIAASDHIRRNKCVPSPTAACGYTIAAIGIISGSMAFVFQAHDSARLYYVNSKIYDYLLSDNHTQVRGINLTRSVIHHFEEKGIPVSEMDARMVRDGSAGVAVTMNSIKGSAISVIYFDSIPAVLNKSLEASSFTRKVLNVPVMADLDFSRRKAMALRNQYDEFWDILPTGMTLGKPYPGYQPK